MSLLSGSLCCSSIKGSAQKRSFERSSLRLMQFFHVHSQLLSVKCKGQAKCIIYKRGTKNVVGQVFFARQPSILL